MHSDISERIIEEAAYMLKTNGTVRQTAEKFNLSKSTIHKDLSEKLYYIDPKLYIKVRKLLSYNLSKRHIRGGIATKNKYLNLKRLKKQVKSL